MMADPYSTEVIPALVIDDIVGPDQLPGTITAASDPPPEQLDTNSLPHAWVFCGEAEYDFSILGEPDQWLEIRTYRLQVAVLTLAMATPETREARIRAVLHPVALAMIQTDEFDHTDHVFDYSFLGDSGPAILPEYEGKFLGFEIRFQVTYQYRT